MLAPYRVLDLTDESGFLCGKILADLGADVLKIEPPGGDTARAIGPFSSDQPDAATGLYWVSYNTNKRGISVRGVENIAGHTRTDRARTRIAHRVGGSVDGHARLRFTRSGTRLCPSA